ncbi:hypothetical protein ABNF97_03975 [Plantactinospora sp. B6F1]|uniref:hypothetical protein n=1 Tax=Plantactinospora sp. B6F1 TaxID=3158971 RepID=UPI0032D91682
MTGRASVQFAGDQALIFRVVKVDPKPTYHGWAWITGYVLDQAGQAVDRREIFVQPAGLQILRTPARVRPAGAVRRPAGGRRA